MAKISTLAMLFGLLCGLAAPASVSAVLQNQSKPPAAATSPDSDEGQALPISGTWVLPDQHDQGVTFQTKLSFFRSHEENVYTVHEAVQCSRRNKSLSSQAEAPVKATVDGDYNSGESQPSASRERYGLPGAAHHSRHPTLQNLRPMVKRWSSANRERRP